MIGYNPSHLNKNETLLEAFHRVEAYLKANPQYQVYQSSAQYQEGTQEYALDTIVVPEGSKVSAGDVVLFSNVYYAVITAVSETTFSIETATNFRGTDGIDGVTPNLSVLATVDNNEGTPSVEVTKGGSNANPLFTLDFHNLKGKTGATGETGETGLSALTYSKTNAALQAGTFTTDLAAYNRTPLIGEICSYFSTSGYCGTGIIQEINSNIVTVRTVGKVSTTGPRGATGDTGPIGPKGDEGNAIYLYSGLLDSSVTEVPSTQVTVPEGRHLQSDDILFSTNENSFGALASVFTVMGLGGTATVEFIGQLSAGGDGGTTLNRYVAHGNARLISKIIFNAKSILAFTNITYTIPLSIGIREDGPMEIYCGGTTASGKSIISAGFRIVAYGTRENPTGAIIDQNRLVEIRSDGTITAVEYSPQPNDYYIHYVNDVEITL